MFDYQSGKHSQIPILLTFSGLGIILGFGICGVGIATSAHAATFPTILVKVGLFMFFVSLATFLVTGLVALIHIFVDTIRR